MKKPLSTDKVIRTLKKASRDRTAQLKVLSASPVTRSAIRQARAETLQIVTQHLRDTGLDLRKIKAIQKRLGVELARGAAQQKAAAIKAAPKQKQRVNKAIAQRVKAASALAFGPSLNVNPFVVLDTPILIWPQPLFALTDSNTAPFDSWVKFDFSNSNSEGTQSVNFYYYWTSPFSSPVTINAETFLSAVGHLQANADWGLASHGADVGVVALFSAWVGAPQYGIDPPQMALGEVRALSMFLTGGDSHGTPINSEVTLINTMLAVPPGAGVIFEVSLAVYYYSDDGGHIDADFASGDFRLASPFVAFSIVGAPNPAWGVNVNPVATAD